jgi:serine O-acetyltransferase
MSVQELARVIKADLYRYQGATGIKGFLSCYHRRVGFKYTLWMRLASFLEREGYSRVVLWIVRRRLWVYSMKYGISIPPKTDIGPGFFIGHFGGIVVHEGVRIGCNFTLGHGVTIGQRNRGKWKGVPTIGDGVHVGAGACIIGSVSIGSNAVIGAHAVVVHDVGNNEVVVGNPARPISKAGSEGYVKWTIDGGLP